MKKLSLIILFVVMGLIIPQMAAGEESPEKDPIKIAEEYMKRLTSGDFDKLGRLYHDEAAFVDFTAESVAQGGYHFRGKKDILDFWKKTSKGRISYKFTPAKQFSSGNYVVMIGVYDYKGTGEPLGLSKELIVRLKTDAVTTLKIVDGKVVSHLDMVDYKNLMKQIGEQKDAFDKKKK